LTTLIVYVESRFTSRSNRYNSLRILGASLRTTLRGKPFIRNVRNIYIYTYISRYLCRVRRARARALIHPLKSGISAYRRCMNVKTSPEHVGHSEFNDLVVRSVPRAAPTVTFYSRRVRTNRAERYRMVGKGEREARGTDLPTCRVTQSPERFPNRQMRFFLGILNKKIQRNTCIRVTQQTKMD